MARRQPGARGRRSATYRPARGTDQSCARRRPAARHARRLLVEHLFPADGDYKLNIAGLAGAGYVARHGVPAPPDRHARRQQGVRGADRRRRGHRRRSTSSRRRRWPRSTAASRTSRCTVTAGPHTIGVTFVARTYAESDEVLHVRSGRVPAEDRSARAVGSSRSMGPFDGVGPERDAEPRAHLRLPAADGRRRAAVRDARSCRRWRARGLPPAGDRRDLAAPLALLQRRRAAAAISRPASATRSRRSSPARSSCIAPSARPADSRAGHDPSRHRPRPRRRGCRSSSGAACPDDELLAVAEQRDAVERARARGAGARMLADPRAASLVTNFALPVAEAARPRRHRAGCHRLSRASTIRLRDAFRRELELFVDERASARTAACSICSSADYTFVNERLALHYGIPARARRPLPPRRRCADENRWGLLGKGGVLMATSYAEPHGAGAARRLDPREPSLGTPPAAPPPDVEAFPENKDGEQGADRARDPGAAPRATRRATPATA